MSIDRDNFQKVLQDIRVRRESTYRILIIDLNTARSEFFFSIAGGAIYVATASDANATVDVRLNERENDVFTLKKQQSVKALFHGFFLSNTAQSGKTITLAIATQVPDLFEFLDTSSQASIDATLSSILDELKGLSSGTYNQTAVGTGVPVSALIIANTGRKSALVQSDPTSDGDLLLGLDATLSTSKCFSRLKPGESWATDDYQGAIWARAASGVAVKANWNEVA